MEVNLPGKIKMNKAARPPRILITVKIFGNKIPNSNEVVNQKLAKKYRRRFSPRIIASGSIRKISTHKLSNASLERKSALSVLVFYNWCRFRKNRRCFRKVPSLPSNVFQNWISQKRFHSEHEKTDSHPAVVHVERGLKNDVALIVDSYGLR